MAYNFLPSDRDQPFLLPPDLRDWLPQGHLAWFILDVTDQLDLVPFYRAHRSDGHGHPAYDPQTLLGVLLYAYAIGVRSSRQIERRCHEDVAFRVLAGNQLPDHVTIARFRVRHEQALAGSWSSRCGCAPPLGWSASGWSPWMAPRWLPTPPTPPATPETRSSARLPRSCGRPPRPTSARTWSTARPVGTSSPRRWPPRPAGWRGCATPRPCWRPRRPNANGGMSSGSPRWPPQPGPRASNPGAHQAAARRPIPRRPPMSPTPPAASCTPGVAASRATTPRRSPPWSR